MSSHHCKPRGTCWENLEVTFTNQNLKAVTLSGGHIHTPYVTVIPSDSLLANFNFFTSSITNTGVTIECSANYTGTVYVQAVSTL